MTELALIGGEPEVQIPRPHFEWGRPARKYVDEVLDIVIPTHGCHPKDGSYAILVRNRVEADEENKNLSADDVAEKQMSTETILERIIHELFHHWKTGKHLDVSNWTLCSGSRYSGGHVPLARWHGVRFALDWTLLAYRSEHLRSRVAVG
mgnify:CR=1 FL=1